MSQSSLLAESGSSNESKNSELLNLQITVLEGLTKGCTNANVDYHFLLNYFNNFFVQTMMILVHASHGERKASASIQTDTHSR